MAQQQPWGEGIEGAGWQKVQGDLAMCTCSPEHTQYPGLNQKKCGQQVERGLMRTHPKYCIHLWSPQHKQDVGPAGVSQEETQKDGQRAQAPFLYRQESAEGAGAFHPGEDKASESSLWVTKGVLQEI